MDFKYTAVIDGQTIFDVAMQEYGNHLCVFILQKDNLFWISDLNSVLIGQTQLKIRKNLAEVEGARPKIVAHYATNGIKVISNAL